MTVEQLINTLNNLIKDNPKNAYKEVVMSQYDNEDAEMDGVVSCTNVNERPTKIILE